MARRQKLGRWGEQAAALYLDKSGWEVVGRNIYTPYGEIDLIAKRGDEWIFVEVKTRTSYSFGLPEAAISTRKLRHMIDSASYYFQEHPEIDGTWRIDVAAVFRNTDGQANIEYFENVTGQNAE